MNEENEQLIFYVKYKHCLVIIFTLYLFFQIVLFFMERTSHDYKNEVCFLTQNFPDRTDRTSALLTFTKPSVVCMKPWAQTGGVCRQSVLTDHGKGSQLFTTVHGAYLQAKTLFPRRQQSRVHHDLCSCLESWAFQIKRKGFGGSKGRITDVVCPICDALAQLRRLHSSKYMNKG